MMQKPFEADAFSPSGPTWSRTHFMGGEGTPSSATANSVLRASERKPADRQGVVRKGELRHGVLVPGERGQAKSCVPGANGQLAGMFRLQVHILFGKAGYGRGE